MRKKILGITLAACAVVFGSAVSASAQTTYRTRDGRVVTVYPNGRRVVRSQRGRIVRRSPNGRSVVTLPNGRRVVRSSRSRQSYPQVRRARTYRLSDGRIVTVYPNGRRVYRRY
jgi:hypothetical protein